MEKIKRVEDLEVFKLSHSLVMDVYKLVPNFPSGEKLGLIPQIKRSAYSIPMNLIEGSSRLTTKEYRRFVGIAIRFSRRNFLSIVPRERFGLCLRRNLSGIKRKV